MESREFDERLVFIFILSDAFAGSLLTSKRRRKRQLHLMCQNLRAPSSKDLADPALSPAHRSELFKTLLAQYAPDVVGLQEAKGVMAGTAGKLSPGHGLRLYGGRQNQPRRAGLYCDPV